MSKKPPTDDGNKEGVEKLRAAERVRYKMKLAKGLEALPRRERDIELKRLHPLLKSIAATATFLYDALKKPKLQTSDSGKASNVIHIAAWVPIKSRALAVKPHKTLWAYLSDCKDLLEAFMPLVKANAHELKNNPALLKHFQAMFNGFLTETGTLLVVNSLIAAIEGDDEPPQLPTGA